MNTKHVLEVSGRHDRETEITSIHGLKDVLVTVDVDGRSAVKPFHLKNCRLAFEIAIHQQILSFAQVTRV